MTPTVNCLLQLQEFYNKNRLSNLSNMAEVAHSDKATDNDHMTLQFPLTLLGFKALSARQTTLLF